jgi:hypothetical protein
MAIYLRGKSWYYDFVHKGQRYTGSFGPVSRTVAKEEEARKKAEVLEHRLNPAKARKNSRFTEFAKEYEDWIQANRRPETHRRIAGTIRRLVEFFGTKKLNELTPWHLEQFKKARKDAGLLPNSVNVDVAVLKAILKKACSWGQLANDPGKDVKLLKVTQRKTRFLSEEEEGALHAVCSPDLRRIIEVGLLTGFRRR